MSKNIEMNYKGSDSYDIIYPRTICEMVIDLLNEDTKQLMGLSSEDQADDAFRELYLMQVLDGRALINFTVTGDDGTPCKGVQIESAQFCDAHGNLTPTVVTNNEGKVAVFVNAVSVQASISNYANLSDWSETIQVEFGNQYNKDITLTRYNFRQYLSSGNCKFSEEVVRVDVSVGGGGGGGGTGSPSDASNGNSISGGGGGGGRTAIQESVSFSINTNYSYSVGSGGVEYSVDGGSSSFLGINASGGGSATYSDGAGNGNGGARLIIMNANQGTYRGNSGSKGTMYIYDSFSTEALYGGGGAGGSLGNGGVANLNGGVGGLPGGGYSGSVSNYGSLNGQNGQDGLGGGGAGQTIYGGRNQWQRIRGTRGGSGVVAIRMYRQSDLS